MMSYHKESLPIRIIAQTKVNTVNLHSTKKKIVNNGTKGSVFFPSEDDEEEEGALDEENREESADGLHG